ncbi:MAG: amidohydrolase family protein [Bacillota bacterium]|nr:amidohydrolase family protein [Candidatus Fermentithermobacillaceae bacterium]
MIIDVHNHFYPKAYLEMVKKGGCVAQAGQDEEGNLLIIYEGDFNVVDRGHADENFRLTQLDKFGIDTQVVTMTTPGVHIEEAGRGIEMARASNEGFAEIADKSGGRYAPLAALPLQAPKAAADELVHAVTKLGLKGGTLFTNVCGKTLDLPEFRPVFEAAAALEVPLFIHPTTPVPAQMFLDFRLAATVGFTVDTTVAFARLTFSGLLDEIPGLKLVASHLGGNLPFLAERLDRGFEAYPECKKPKRKPSDYLKEIFYDCVLFNPKTVRFAIDTLGVTQFMVGSDYPHQIGSLEKAVKVVRDLELTDSEKEMVFATNAKALFGL